MTDEEIAKAANNMLWDLIEDGNEIACEALIDDMADLMLECRAQGTTFDEMLLRLKDRFPRETGRHIDLALKKANLKGFDVSGRSPQ